MSEIKQKKSHDPLEFAPKTLNMKNLNIVNFIKQKE